MTDLSKRLAEAVDAAAALPADQQDLIAAEVTERVRLLARPAMAFTEQERQELEAELDAARRGVFASEAEVTAVYTKHGV